MSLPGLHTAKVTGIEDPSGQNRVQIKFTGNGGEDREAWARMANMYATANAGTFFIPEIGDEVLVGYINDNKEMPVILGSLYNERHTPPKQAGNMNDTKAIVTRSKLELSFDDDKKTITINTPARNSITLDDEGKCIELKDEHLNSIRMDANGIHISSPKNITIKAQTSVDIFATSAVSMKANKDVEIEGANVKLSAQLGLTAKGNSSAELSASGTTTIKGAMVTIN